MDNEEYQKRRTEIEFASYGVNGIRIYGVRIGYNAVFIKILPRREGYVVQFRYNYLIDKYNQGESKSEYEFADTYPEALQAIKKHWNLTSEQYEKVMDVLVNDNVLYQIGNTIRDSY